MYCRQILRARFVGTGATHLNRLHRVCLTEVALKINCLVLILMNIFLSLPAAEHLDNTCPTSSGGGCGKSAVPPRHQEVWFIVAPLSCFLLFQQQFSAQSFLFRVSVSCVSLTHRDHCAPEATRWGWRRRPARSTAPQLQPSSPRLLTKASPQISFMKMRR